MNKARLIKHSECLERAQAAQQPARLVAVVRIKADTVRNWVKRQQTSRQPNARKLFAALFAQPPASCIETKQPC